jgi:RecQ family ATP-dependent DNA helicase
MAQVPRTNIHEFVARWKRGELPQLKAFGDAQDYAYLEEAMPDLVPAPVPFPVPIVPNLTPGADRYASAAAPVRARQQPGPRPGTAGAQENFPTFNTVNVYGPVPADRQLHHIPTNSTAVATAATGAARACDTSPLGAFAPASSSIIPKRTLFGQTPPGAVGAQSGSPAGWSSPAVHAPAPPSHAISDADIAARLDHLLQRSSTLNVEKAAVTRRLHFASNDEFTAIDAECARIDAQIQLNESELATLMNAKRAKAAPSLGPTSPSMNPPFAAGGFQLASTAYAAAGPSPFGNADGGGGGGGSARGGFETPWAAGSGNGFGGSGPAVPFDASNGPFQPRPGAFQWEGVGAGMTREQTRATVQADVNPKGEWVRENFPWSTAVRQHMRDVFGLHQFRPCQLEVINSTMAGRDVLVLLPTGGGKSLCYQLPAIIEEVPKVTIVFSPLVSLIQDQVQQLRAVRIGAMALTASTPDTDRRSLFDEWRALDIKSYLVYITPEFYARSDHFIQQLQNLARHGRVARFIIDEAHCISQWGHDFRPDYRKLQFLKRLFPTVPILALTATATDAVQRDVMNTLGMPRACLFHASFNRPNLRYFVQKIGKSCELEVAKILNQPHLRNKCGIVYCLSKKDCEDMSRVLKSQGINADFYHSEAPDKDFKQNQWSSDRIRVMCATIAFGMGINKPDVRVVVHASLPKSIEGYYQESGRAGRDGLPAECHLLWSGVDRQFHDRMAFGKDEGAIKCLHRIQQFALDNVTCRRNQQLSHFGEVEAEALCFKDGNLMCDNCQNRAEVKWTPMVVDVTGDAIDLCRNLVHLGRMTAKQLVAVFRGTPSDYGPVIAGRVNAKGYPPGMNKNPSVSKETLERTVLLLLLHDVMRERLEQTAAKAFSVVAYLEMGDAKQQQRLQRRELILSYEQRKPPSLVAAVSTAGARSTAAATAAADAAVDQLLAGPQTTRARKKKADAPAVDPAVVAEFEQEDVGVVNEVMAQDLKPAASAPLPATLAPTPAAGRKSGGVRIGAAPFREPASRQHATFVDSQDGAIPTPLDPKLPVATPADSYSSVATPAPAPIAPQVARVSAATLALYVERIKNALDQALAQIGDELGVKAHHLGPKLTAEIASKVKVPNWGSIDDILAIEGMTAKKLWEWGHKLWAIYRILRHTFLHDCQRGVSAEEMEEARLRANPTSTDPQRSLRPSGQKGANNKFQLIDEDTSPARMLPQPSASGASNYPQHGGFQPALLHLEPLSTVASNQVSPQRPDPSVQLVSGPESRFGSVQIVAPQQPYAPIGPVDIPVPPRVNATIGVKRTLFQPTVGPKPPQPPAETAYAPPPSSHPQAPMESAEAMFSPVRDGPVLLEDDDNDLLNLCDRSQLNTPISSRPAGNSRGSSVGGALRTSGAITFSDTHRSSVLLLPNHTQGQNTDEVQLTMPAVNYSANPTAATASTSSTHATAPPPPAPDMFSAALQSRSATSHYSLASDSDDDVQLH